jgi:LysM repeat protein/plastocyanin
MNTRIPFSTSRVLLVVALALLSSLFVLPAAAAPPQSGPYIVQWGDTLFSIAMRYGTTVQALMSANGLSGSLIYAGQTLTIPTGSAVPAASTTIGLCPYVVRPGEWVYLIARRYGASPSYLISINGLYNPDHIYPGQVLRVPCTTYVQPTGPTATYVVQRGDNLFRIGIKYSTSWYAIQYANGLPGTLIYPGQTLIIPNVGSVIYPPNIPTPAVTPVSPTTHQIIIQSPGTFNPQSITINAGDTVTWINNDTQQHTVTSGTSAAATTGVFDLFLNPGQSISFRFTAPNTYNYFCRTHGETGQIVVR